MKGTVPLRSLVALGAVKAALGAGAYLWTFGQPVASQGVYPIEINVLMVVIFGAVGSLLVIGGRHDERAVDLGAFFFCIGSIYANRPLARLETVALPLDLLRWLPLELFAPYLFWLFVRRFPRSPATARADRFLELGASVGAGIGAAMFVLNIPLLLEQRSASFVAPELCHEFGSSSGRLYLLFVIGMTGLALPLALWKIRRAERAERGRVRLFLSALVLGVSPIIVASLLQLLVPAADRWMTQTADPNLLGWAVFGPFLLVPCFTAYAVLVHRVLDMRLIARKALQYALAKYSALTLAAVPLLGLAFYLYDHRRQTLQEIFSGSSAVLLTAAAGLGVWAFVRRQRLLEVIDRRFFREQFDARQILTPLVERIRNAAGRRELSDLVAHGIDRALHLQRVALLVEEPSRGVLADPSGRNRALDTSGPLVSLLSDSSQPLEVALEPHSSLLARLSVDDREWLFDGDFRLLVPVFAFGGSLIGVIALGEKMSSLPFLKEDRQLLSTIAHSVALALELESLRTSTNAGKGDADKPDTGPVLPSAGNARECFGCGRLYMPYSQRCTLCERDLDPSPVPYVLPGKFRFERRIGAGGMGVVYRAVDLALNRPVAVKTMRRVSVDDALRLRREARAAAVVSHPNLAFIYGVESWRGTPMLILEFLEGGTLEDQLYEDTLSFDEAIRLGIALAGALEKLHAANILHRDLKPSNIGYSRDGTPKLMDFGIARVQHDVRHEVFASGSDGDASAEIRTHAWGSVATPATASHQLVGTLHYLSPEAVAGGPPEAGFDLWGLTLVLYESLSGERNFNGTIRQVMEDIREARIPDLREMREECPDELAEFFAEALSPHREPRPATARELRERLQKVRRSLQIES